MMQPSFRRIVSPAMLILASWYFCAAQPQIPIGSWRVHLSYNDIKTIALAPGGAFAATESGILRIGGSDLSTYNTLNALTTTGITALAYDAARSQLLVGYEDGNLDIISEDESINFNRLATTTTIIGSKRINHIAIRNNMAYLASDFGIVVFNLEQLELKETWRDLGEDGEKISVLNVALDGDRIFAATSDGVIEGNLGNNLLDFNQWTHHNEDDLSGQVTAVANIGAVVFAAVDGQDLYQYDGSAWLATGLFPGSDFHSFAGSDFELLVSADEAVWSVNASLGVTPVKSPLITAPNAIQIAGPGTYWIGDTRNGLLSNATGVFQSYLPNGPSNTLVTRLAFGNGTLYAVAGSHENGVATNREGILDMFNNGEWSSVTVSETDLTDVKVVDGYTYVSSFGGGVMSIRGADTIRFDESNSPLTEKTVTALAASAGTLWVAEFGTAPGIHRFADNEWTSYTAFTSLVDDIVVDLDGNVWVAPDPALNSGIGFLNPDGQSLHRTTGQGFGGLPHARVNAAAVDKSGYVWVGTDAGIAYFYAPAEDAVRPIFEGRFLLQSEKITSIAVDGGDRKWVATTSGVWLFDDLGEYLVHHFTTENSPLLSNSVHEIEIDPNTGEVFFATDKGLISYRADATEASPVPDIRIFPNPVTASFSGVVGIEGVARDAVVKITDVSGKLIWQTRANGGTATWNLRDYEGNRAAIGIYVIFASAENGADRVVGKIAVID